jgi:simple sugar transport system substrate-binding protein
VRLRCGDPARRFGHVALAVALTMAVAGCGEATQVREPDLVAEGGAARVPAIPARRTPASRGNAVRISVVTHGQASSPFWRVVRNGIDAAARQLDASVSYRSPDTYSVSRMRALIDAAVAGRPDGLVVSIPSPALAGSIRRAVRAGIPVVSINSGSDEYRRLGILAHVGQPEDRAGAETGRRLARAGVRRGLCVNHEPANVGLNLRCRGFVEAIRRAGGDAAVLTVDVQDRAATRLRLARIIRARRIDGVLTLNTDGAQGALDAVRADRRIQRVRLATFDLSPEVLQAVDDGRMRFAVDQQAYLQGFLPITLLSQRVRYGLFPARGDVIPTGPSFVTRATAGQVLRLSNRGIR